MHVQGLLLFFFVAFRFWFLVAEMLTVVPCALTVVARLVGGRYFSPHDPNTKTVSGIGGLDLELMGIPEEEEMLQNYARAAGLEQPIDHVRLFHCLRWQVWRIHNCGCSLRPATLVCFLWYEISLRDMAWINTG